MITYLCMSSFQHLDTDEGNTESLPQLHPILWQKIKNQFQCQLQKHLSRNGTHCFHMSLVKTYQVATPELRHVLLHNYAL